MMSRMNGTVVEETHLQTSLPDVVIAGDGVGGAELGVYDAEQARLMEEVCIVLDRDDQPTGQASKKTCERYHEPV